MCEKLSISKAFQWQVRWIWRILLCLEWNRSKGLFNNNTPSEKSSQFSCKEPQSIAQQSGAKKELKFDQGLLWKHGDGLWKQNVQPQNWINFSSCSKFSVSGISRESWWIQKTHRRKNSSGKLPHFDLSFHSQREQLYRYWIAFRESERSSKTPIRSIASISWLLDAFPWEVLCWENKVH